MTVDTDILIAGGGIAGTALAVALARSCFTVTICDGKSYERRSAADFDGRAYAVAPDCQRMLKILGLWAALSAEAQPITAMRIGLDRPDQADRPQTLAFDAAENNGPLGYMIEDRHLRLTLLEALAQNDRIRHLSPIQVSHHEVEAGSVRAVTADGRRMRARLLVASDGRDSPRAKSAGLVHFGRDYRQSGLVAAVSHDRPHGGVARQIFHPSGPFAMLPLTGKRSSLVWAESRETAQVINALPEAAYLAEIERRSGGTLGGLELIGRRWSYPLHLSLAQRYAAPRVALLGDAAHGIHPLAGQGLNLGLRDVAALTEVVTTAHRRGEDIGALDVLERYQRWRRFDATLQGLICDGLNRGFSSHQPVLRGILGTGMGMLGSFGSARRLMMNFATGQGDDAPSLLQGRAL